MKYALINLELFNYGGYSHNFKSVVESLQRNGTILTEESSTELYKAIFEAGVSSALSSIEHKDESYIEIGWNLIQEGI